MKAKNKIFKTKKADIFMPMLVLVTLVAYVTLALVILNNNQERLKEIPVGLQAVSTLRVYKEIDNADFYAQKAAEISQVQTLEILGKNAGYPEKNSCKKIDQTLTELQYIIFDKTCGEFNSNINYKSQFETTLSNYLKKYQSQYTTTENLEEKPLIDQIKSFFSQTIDIKDDLYLKTTSTAFVQSLTLKENEITTSSQSISFEPKKYPLEFSTYNSFIEHQIKFQLPGVILTDYNNLYETLFKCKESKDTCEAIIKQQFPKATVIKANELLKINTNTEIPIILAFNPNSELPKVPALQ